MRNVELNLSDLPSFYFLIVVSFMYCTFNLNGQNQLLTAKEMYLYDSTGQIQSSPEAITSYTYDTLDRKNQSILQIKDSSGNFINDSKSVFAYTSFDSIKGVISYTWNDSTWELTSRRGFKYNSSNQVSEDSTDYYLGGSWFPTLKYLYQYSNDNVKTIFQLTWINGSYDTIREVEHFYGSDTRLDSIYAYGIVSVGSPLVLSSKVYHYYGNLTDTVRVFQGNQGNFQPSLLTIRNYDLQDKQISEKSFLWDTNLGDWVKMEKDTTIYRSNGQIDYEIGYLRRANIDEWAPFAKTVYVYEPTGVNNIQETDRIIIYPNPASLNLLVKGVGKKDFTYTIINMRGELILQTERPNIDISGLEPGIYLLSGRSGNETFSKKFVKLTD